MATWAYREATASTSNASSYAALAITPAVNDLLVVAVVASGTVAAGGVTSTGSGATAFDKITSATSASGVDTLYLFVSTTKVTAADSHTVTFTCTGDAATGAVVTIYSLSGMTKLGSAAVRQSAVQNNGSASGTPSVTFPSATLNSNPVIGIVGNGSNPAAMTPPSGWTEDATADKGYNTPPTGSEVAYRNSGHTSTTVTWGSTSATAFGAIAAEFDLNTAPTVALNTADATNFGADTTPTLEFTGTDAEGDDVRYNTQIGTSSDFDIDSYAILPDITYAGAAIGTATATGRGQAITGDGGVVGSAQFRLKKNGSPTGNANAYIYAHTGTYGTTSLPTGAALAVSEPFDVSALTTTFSPVIFQFLGANRITLTNATNYVLTIEKATQDASNYVVIGVDNAAPTHGGASVYKISGTWATLTSEDVFFYLSTASLDKLSGTDSGFVNTVNGGDTDPFTSGQKVSFTVQAGDALPSGTYYWRARGIDPSGKNGYGAWPAARSFTISAAPPIPNKIFQSNQSVNRASTF